MPITLERICQVSNLVQKNFNKKPIKKNAILSIRGVFSDIGRKIRKEGRTSVDLIREIRNI